MKKREKKNWYQEKIKNESKRENEQIKIQVFVQLTKNEERKERRMVSVDSPLASFFTWDNTHSLPRGG